MNVEDDMTIQIKENSFFVARWWTTDDQRHCVALLARAMPSTHAQDSAPGVSK